jgi:hypothetical protein
MAKYQRIEYRIGKDGTISETVVDGLGASCTDATHDLEEALGTVEQREFKPEYYDDDEAIAGIQFQSNQ